MVTAATNPTFDLHFKGEKSGPYSVSEISSMLMSGMIDYTAHVWQDGWTEWKRVLTVIPEVPMTPYAARTKRQTYRQRIGKRSFLFQILLVIWTVSYVGWLLSMYGSMSSHLPAVPASPTPSFAPAPNPFDISAMAFSSWICLGIGWCVIGLPLLISAVATMRED